MHLYAEQQGLTDARHSSPSTPQVPPFGWAWAKEARMESRATEENFMAETIDLQNYPEKKRLELCCIFLEFFFVAMSERSRE